jgi:hypothetical protein
VKCILTISGNAVRVESAGPAVQQWKYGTAEREATIDVSIHFGQRP